MIKFTLTIWVCSFLTMPSVCMPPVQSPAFYNSWYECARAAHQESVKILSKLGYKYVNENEIGMKYSCQKVSTI